MKNMYKTKSSVFSYNEYMKRFVIKAMMLILLISICFALAACPEEKVEIFTVKYIATEGGYIDGDISQSITSGQDAETVTAKPLTGYLFTGWSDGVETAERTETNLTENIEVTASFAKQSVTVTYSATTGGIIEGEVTQTIKYGDDALEIIAKPLEGYEFIGWSDSDSTNPARLDSDIKEDINATAKFAKKTFNLHYLASEGGYIDGDSVQTIEYDGDSIAVTAKPLFGYEFTGWSDNYHNAKRLDKNIQSNITVTANFIKITFSAVYAAGEGGSIEGETTQTIEYDETAQTVIAVPDEGYKFLKWSDNDSTNPTRTDTHIRFDIAATAEFEEISKTFTYIYHGATVNNTETSITITYSDILKDNVLPIVAIKFIVPEREHYTFEGWCLDYHCMTQLTDECGNVGSLWIEHILDIESDYVYAKWRVNEQINYKILMVFVTEIKARLPLDDYLSGPKVDVYYKMTDAERQFCSLIPGQIEKVLNETFDGLVTFEIDAYFTTETIDESSFSHTLSTPTREFYVMAKDILEVGPLLKDYRSVISTIHFNGHDIESYSAMGRGADKYAFVYLGVFIRSIKNSGLTLNDLCDLSHPLWAFYNIYLSS